MVLLEGFLAAQELSVAEGRSPGVEGLHSFSCVRAGGWEVGCGSWQQVEGGIVWTLPASPVAQVASCSENSAIFSPCGFASASCLSP